MKFILLLLMMISAISCASHEKRDTREPSSVEEKTDVTRGINTDFYGGAVR